MAVRIERALMNDFQFSVLELEAPLRDSTTPYGRRQRELEEQAFYERFGCRSMWERVATPAGATVAFAVAALGAIVVVLKESLGS
jgi:hypothetical protein